MNFPFPVLIILVEEKDKVQTVRREQKKAYKEKLEFEHQLLEAKNRARRVPG